MIAVLDSATPPSDEQLHAAAAAGVQGWAGYFAGPNIEHGWAQTDFERVLAVLPHTLAYCSGHADPAAMRAQGEAWGVPIALDVEPSIRPDGDWVEPWLEAASPSAYYSDISDMTTEHVNGHAAALIVASRSTDPQRTWPWWIATPAKPHGNQWQGSHTEFGADVDRCWFDEALFTALQGDAMNPDQVAQLLADVAAIKAKVEYLEQIFDSPYETADGTQGPAPWSNVEVQRRQLADLGARENPRPEIPYVRPSPPTPVVSPEPPNFAFPPTATTSPGGQTSG